MVCDAASAVAYCEKSKLSDRFGLALSFAYTGVSCVPMRSACPATSWGMSRTAAVSVSMTIHTACWGLWLVSFHWARLQVALLEAGRARVTHASIVLRCFLFSCPSKCLGRVPLVAGEIMMQDENLIVSHCVGSFSACSTYVRTKERAIAHC